MMIVLKYNYVLFCFRVYLGANSCLSSLLTFLAFMTLSFNHWPYKFNQFLVMTPWIFPEKDVQIQASVF